MKEAVFIGVKDKYEFGHALHTFIGHDAFTSIVIPPDRYDYLKLNEKFYVSAYHYKPANVVYYYNYDDAPNENIYWIDLITGDNLHLNPEPPEREGYDFRGWFTDELAILEWDGSLPSSPDESLTLYAGWSKKPYRIVEA